MWTVGRVVEGSGLLIRRTERFRGFESHTVCQKPRKSYYLLVWVTRSHMNEVRLFSYKKMSMQSIAAQRSVLVLMAGLQQVISWWADGIKMRPYKFTVIII